MTCTFTTSSASEQQPPLWTTPHISHRLSSREHPQHLILSLISASRFTPKKTAPELNQPEIMQPRLPLPAQEIFTFTIRCKQPSFCQAHAEHARLSVLRLLCEAFPANMLSRVFSFTTTPVVCTVPLGCCSTTGLQAIPWKGRQWRSAASSLVIIARRCCWRWRY